jgi:hypothetical protein
MNGTRTSQVHRELVISEGLLTGSSRYSLRTNAKNAEFCIIFL